MRFATCPSSLRWGMLFSLWLLRPVAIPAAEQFMLRVTSERAQIRAGNSVLAGVPKDTRLWAFGVRDDGEWAEVKAPGSEQHGWISSKQFVRIEPSAADIPQLTEAQAHRDRFEELSFKQQNHTAGLEELKQAFEIERDVRGADHPEVAALGVFLGMGYSLLGDFALTRTHFNEAVATFKQTLGTTPPATVNALYDYGRALHTLGDYDGAAKFYAAALPGKRELHGNQSLEIAEALSLLGDVQTQTGLVGEAQASLRGAVKVYEALERRGLSTPPQTLRTLGTAFIPLKEYSEASRLLEKSLTRELATSERNEDQIAATNKLLAMLYRAAGGVAGSQFLEALLPVAPQAQFAAKDRPEIKRLMHGQPGNNPAFVTFPALKQWLLQGKGDLDNAAGRKAGQGFRAADLDRWLKAKARRPDLAHVEEISVSNPGSEVFLSANMGRLEAAKAAARRYAASTHFRERQYVDSGIVDAMVYAAIEAGDDESALQFVAAIEAEERTGIGWEKSPKDWTFAELVETGYDPSSERVQRCTRILDFGTRALAYDRLTLFERLADADTRVFFRQAADKDATGHTLLAQGLILLVDGETKAGLEVFRLGMQRMAALEQARWQRERKESPELGDVDAAGRKLPRLGYIGARLLVALYARDVAEATSLVKAAAGDSAYEYEGSFGLGAAYEIAVPSAQSAVQFRRRYHRRLFALHQLSPMTMPDAGQTALESLLNARRLRSMSLTRFAYRPRGPYNDVLVRMQSQAAALHFLRHSAMHTVAAQQQADWLLARVSSGLEAPVADLHRSSIGNRTDDDVQRQAPAWRTTDEVRGALGSTQAVLEFVQGQAVERDGENRFRLTPLHYGAWLLRADREPQFQYLGLAAELDRSIHECRDAIRSAAGGKDADFGPGSTLAKLLQAISARLLAPFEANLEGIDDLIVCPDGELWLLPWVAMPQRDGRTLLEHCAVSLRFTSANIDEHSKPVGGFVDRPLIFANPDADALPSAIVNSERVVLKHEARDPIHIDLAGVKPLLPPGGRLPGTETEAKQISPHLKNLTGKEATVYLGANALEELVKRIHSPEYLVFSTHGFFLGSPPHTSQEAATSSLDMANPLLRAGLVLAGANHAGTWNEARGSDGVLTALEVTQLDLRRTKLVVLSSCDTGVGDVRYGDGVSGLRQAFFLAGAESVVASLWSVDDAATAEIMADFFENLSHGDRGGLALRKAQLRRLEKNRQAIAAHPFYWAAFTLTSR